LSVLATLVSAVSRLSSRVLQRSLALVEAHTVVAYSSLGYDDSPMTCIEGTGMECFRPVQDSY